MSMGGVMSTMPPWCSYRYSARVRKWHSGSAKQLHGTCNRHDMHRQGTGQTSEQAHTLRQGSARYIMAEQLVKP